VAGLGFTENKL